MIIQQRHRPKRPSAIVDLVAELRQPLAAASNYVAAARLLLASDVRQSSPEAVECLECAEVQILRAGELARMLRNQIL